MLFYESKIFYYNREKLSGGFGMAKPKKGEEEKKKKYYYYKKKEKKAEKVKK
ncbi:MAG: hypothetical protein L6N95_04135 [Candidatus Methylarchaceae archaeon HK01B]|nr:hypothetical protein [Candidatus Methylarchaceae archaeon HK01M]MCP8319000.1 hypothetical protein [Candidatus Methylarchaceae archaeon HK01B]